MKHIRRYGRWVLESRESLDPIEQKLADLENLYSLGMIDSQDLLLERIRLRKRLGLLTSLTHREVELVDPETAEEINDFVNEDLLDVKYDYPFTSNEEYLAFVDFIDRDQEVNHDWQVYPDGTLDASQYFPEMGPDQLVQWTDSTGAPASKPLLDYFASQLVSRLDPEAKTGSIKPWSIYRGMIRQLFLKLLNPGDSSQDK